MAAIEMTGGTELNEAWAAIGSENEFVISPRKSVLGRRSVVLERSELAVLADASTLSLALEDGSAHYMGDDFWLVQQYDETAHEHVSVGLTRDDIDRLLATACVGGPQCS